jgi:hypothetical protein
VSENYTIAAWSATPALKQRLVEISGSTQGYLIDALSTIEASAGRKISKVFLNRALNNKVATPMWLVIALTRIAEDDLTMDRNDAVVAAAKWFTIADGEE